MHSIYCQIAARFQSGGNLDIKSADWYEYLQGQVFFIFLSFAMDEFVLDLIKFIFPGLHTLINPSYSAMISMHNLIINEWVYHCTSSGTSISWILQTVCGISSQTFSGKYLSKDIIINGQTKAVK